MYPSGPAIIATGDANTPEARAAMTQAMPTSQIAVVCRPLSIHSPPSSAVRVKKVGTTPRRVTTCCIEVPTAIKGVAMVWTHSKDRTQSRNHNASAHHDR